MFSPPTPQSFASPAPLPRPPSLPSSSMRPSLQPPASGGFAGQQPSGRPTLQGSLVHGFPPQQQQHHKGSPPHSPPQVTAPHQEPSPPFPPQGLTTRPHQFPQASGQGGQFPGTAVPDSHRPQGNPDSIPERPAHQRQPSPGEMALAIFQATKSMSEKSPFLTPAICISICMGKDYLTCGNCRWLWRTS